MKEKILVTLERKEKQYRKINAWFENECDSSISADTFAEWEKNAAECHAQIQILLFLLSDDVE
jgi:oligoendopeptidase F